MPYEPAASRQHPPTVEQLGVTALLWPRVRAGQIRPPLYGGH